jgi:hypothetical protein
MIHVRQILGSSSIERLKGVDNFAFLGLHQVKINHRKNLIIGVDKYIRKMDPLISTLFNTSVDGEYLELHPKFKTYKFVVAEDVDTFQFFSFNKTAHQIKFEVHTNETKK